MESRSIEEIQGYEWPAPVKESDLVQEFHRARKKPIKDLTPRELFILFEQGIEKTYLVDPIISCLAEETFILNGDLLELLLSHFTGETHPTYSQKLAFLDILEKIPECEIKEYTLLDAAIYNFKDYYGN